MAVSILGLYQKNYFLTLNNVDGNSESWDGLSKNVLKYTWRLRNRLDLEELRVPRKRPIAGTRNLSKWFPNSET